MTPFRNRLSPLTQRMAEDMLVRNLAAATIDAYTYHVDKFFERRIYAAPSIYSPQHHCRYRGPPAFPYEPDG